jgi:hypothetical protein
MRNYTPHTIHIYEGNNLSMSITSEGVARASVVAEPFGYITTQPSAMDLEGQIPLYSTKFGKLEGLPESLKNINESIIVSNIAYEAGVREGWENLVVPHDLVRDDQGRVIGCKSFAKPLLVTKQKVLKRLEEVGGDSTRIKRKMKKAIIQGELDYLFNGGFTPQNIVKFLSKRNAGMKSLKFLLELI